jgi:hypothetical protein
VVGYALLCGCVGEVQQNQSESGRGNGADAGSQGDSTSKDSHQRCVDRINTLRESVGLPPLERWVEAESCADEQAQVDGEMRDPHGTFGQCDETAQNTCPGWRGLDEVLGACLDTMWAEGPPPSASCDDRCFQAHGHYLNMTSTTFTKVACGFYTDASGTTWSNQNYQ